MPSTSKWPLPFLKPVLDRFVNNSKASTKITITELLVDPTYESFGSTVLNLLVGMSEIWA